MSVPTTCVCAGGCLFLAEWSKKTDFKKEKTYGAPRTKTGRAGQAMPSSQQQRHGEAGHLKAQPPAAKTGKGWAERHGVGRACCCGEARTASLALCVVDDRTLTSQSPHSYHTVTTQLPHSYHTVTTQLPHSYHTVTTGNYHSSGKLTF